MLLLYATVCPACAETISPLTDLDINEKFRYLIKHQKNLSSKINLRFPVAFAAFLFNISGVHIWLVFFD